MWLTPILGSLAMAVKNCDSKLIGSITNHFISLIALQNMGRVIVNPSHKPYILFLNISGNTLSLFPAFSFVIFPTFLGVVFFAFFLALVFGLTLFFFGGYADALFIFIGHNYRPGISISYNKPLFFFAVLHQCNFLCIAFFQRSHKALPVGFIGKLFNSGVFIQCLIQIKPPLFTKVLHFEIAISFCFFEIQL